MIRLLDSPLLRFQLPYFLTGWKRRLLGGDPLCLTFFVTSVCNGKCIHCLNVGRPPSTTQVLTPAEVDRIAASMKPFANLLVSGGEPFLRDDLAELLEPFSRHCRVGQITVPTNASLPDRIETITARLAGTCPDTKLNIRIGIDGPPHLHDEIRGIDGGFEAAMETARRIERLRADHPNLWLAVMLFRFFKCKPECNIWIISPVEKSSMQSMMLRNNQPFPISFWYNL